MDTADAVDLIAYITDGMMISQTGTTTSPGSRLVMRDDGNLAITRPTGTFGAAPGQPRMVYEFLNGVLRGSW